MILNGIIFNYADMALSKIKFKKKLLLEVFYIAIQTDGQMS